MSIAQALDQGTRSLAAVHDCPRLEAEILLSFTLAKPRSYLRAWPERTLLEKDWECYAALIERRRQGEPIAYLTGGREFWSLDLRVTPATLIPRPETESLVERALARLPADRPVRIADLGTGSGAIALALASERPSARIVATDCSPAALAVARQNARRLQLDNVSFRLGGWCQALDDQRFAMIASNPPYVREHDPHLNQGDVRFEPGLALIAGPDGLEALRHIAANARRHLTPNGDLFLEHGHDQRKDLTGILQQAGYQAVRSYPDLAGLDRVTHAVWPGEGHPRHRPRKMS